ncbi:LysR family transcriptional regulator [Photobacterium carnosum]|uniref:LysR family transcriptional regulator n=1 Tax=Photobacterium carnosum TaxID=2023717 RepID=UPI001E5777EF|nr:LysR family transcriptional regulator [Photobacterium carnosum]MCD9515633.1 LysR family transcriptional regulator [Photobacterium carnosum]
MDIDLIKAFCKLAEKGHYGLASQVLFISQSALTKKIQRLEKDIGCKLFERGIRGTRLTKAGTILLPEAKRLENNFDTFKVLSKNVSSGKCGQLKVGYGISSYQIAPKYIYSFKKNYPDIHVTLDDIPSYKQVNMLLEGRIQISFNRIPISHSLVSIPIGTDRLAIAIHNSIIIDDHHIFDIIKDLDYMRLTEERGPGLAIQIKKYLDEVNLNLYVVREAKDILTLLSMVAANMGYTIIPLSAKLLTLDQIQYIDLPYFNTKWDVGIIWNKSINDPIRDNFIEHIKEELCNN